MPIQKSLNPAPSLEVVVDNTWEEPDIEVIIDDDLDVGLFPRVVDNNFKRRRGVQ